MPSPPPTPDRPKRRFAPFSIRRREHQASRRMAWRLALFLGVVILGTFIYWRIEVWRALEAARAVPSLAETCEDLEETEDLAETGVPEAQTVDEAALAQRLAECEAAGFEPEE